MYPKDKGVLYCTRSIAVHVSQWPGVIVLYKKFCCTCIPRTRGYCTVQGVLLYMYPEDYGVLYCSRIISVHVSQGLEGIVLYNGYCCTCIHRPRGYCSVQGVLFCTCIPRTRDNCTVQGLLLFMYRIELAWQGSRTKDFIRELMLSATRVVWYEIVFRIWRLLIHCQ